MILLLACTGAPDGAKPAPWTELEPVQLESLRPLMTTTLNTPGWRIEINPDAPMGAVLTQGGVLVLDSRWHHSPAVHCLHHNYPFDGQQGRCAEGESELARGAWKVGPPDAVLFHDGEALTLVGDVLYRAPTDLVAHPDPLTWMRVDEGTPLNPAPTGVTHMTADEGEVYVHGDVRWRLEGDTLVEDGAAETRPTADVDVGDLDPLDVAVTPAHEVLLLFEDRVEVYLDETALADNANTLRIWNTTFVEKPKSPVEDLPCEGSDLSVVNAVEFATTNRALLDDLPGCHAVGYTPHHLRRARSCGVFEDADSALGQRTELGILFHDEPPGDYLTFLREEAKEVSIGEVTWVAGLAANADGGHDWVQGILDADLPPTVPFLGLSAHPDVEHFDDPRSKEGWVQTYTSYAPTFTDTAFALEGGGVGLYSGDSRSIFTLDGCPNVLLRECQVLGLGVGGNIIRDPDIAQATLSLHRALAADQPDGTWTWHLPDLGTWDYTEGCTTTDRLWSGDCQGARLQEWLFDVHARYVVNGLAEWTPPSQL